MDLPIENIAAVVGEGLHLDAFINGIHVDVLVDTGATVSLLSDKVVEQWSKGDKEVITKNMKVLLANSKALTVAGDVEADLQLAGINVQHRFIVACIGNDAILGIDFLKNEHCVIDVTNNCLEWGGFVLPLWETDERQQCCRVTVTETVVIPPWTEMLIEGSLEGDDSVG